MRLPFTKMQGAGNDFVVLDAVRQPLQLDTALIRQLCDRHFGVGCDQLLVVEPPSASDCDFHYRIYNSDGSESGQCLNGARAFARFVREKGLSAKNSLRVRTISTAMTLEHVADGLIRVEAGAPRLQPAEVPLDMPERADRYALKLETGEIHFAAVSMGNPHAVLAVADTELAPVQSLGERLQHHWAFPQRVNVGFLQVQDRSHARLRVYERGAGETLACGSGACAAMVAGRLWGQLDARAMLAMRGGDLILEWQGEGAPVFITGPAVTVFEGEWVWPK